VLQSFNQQITEDVFAVLSLEGSVNSRNHLGGTAPAQVRAQAERLLLVLRADREGDPGRR